MVEPEPVIAPAPRVAEPQPVIAPASPPAPAPAPVVEVDESESPAVSVRGIRSGRALHVAIVGRSRDREPGSEFEQTDAWAVVAKAAGVQLVRIVNGSTRITRLETGPGRWDVTVELETAFALPAGDFRDPTEIVVTPPGAPPHHFTVAD